MWRRQRLVRTHRWMRLVYHLAWWPGGLDALDDRGDALAAADAEGDQGGVEVAALQLVEGGAEEHRAGGAEGMAEGDGATVDVDLGGVEVEVADDLERDGGEGF